MPRGKSVLKPRGFRPYAAYETSETQLSSLRAFLLFIYGKNLGSQELWSLFFSVTCRLTLREIGEQREDLYRQIVTAVAPATLEWLRARARVWFEKTVGDLCAGKPYEVRGFKLTLERVRFTTGDEVLWFGPVVPALGNRRAVLQELKNCVCQDLMQLRFAALLRCDICHEYFLRTDQRAARYCSQPCRYRAYEERQRPRRRRRG